MLWIKKIVGIIFFLWCFNSFSQVFCSTEPGRIEKMSHHVEMSRVRLSNQSNFPVMEYHFRIYIHVIQDLNGNKGQSINEINEILDLLDEAFTPHNIFFCWDQSIIYHRHSDYNSPGPWVYNLGRHLNGIDIYLFPSSSLNGNKANSVGISSELYVSGDFVTSHIVSHEMGHVFNLYHTFDKSICQESPDGSNSHICGDQVVDTPPDIYQGIGLYIESGDSCILDTNHVDYNSAYPIGNPNNYMTLTPFNCYSEFTAGQVQRMREAILTLPHLINAQIPKDLSLSGTSYGITQFQGICLESTQKFQPYSVGAHTAKRRITLKPGFRAKYNSRYRTSLKPFNCNDCDSGSGRLASQGFQEDTKKVIDQAQNGIYPNPSLGQFQIDYPYDNNRDYVVSLYDLSGNKMITEELSVDNLSINLPGHIKGVFIVTLKENEILKFRSKLIVKDF